MTNGDGIAVDSSGNAYVTGFTSSTDFPTVNPFQATCNGCGERPPHRRVRGQAESRGLGPGLLHLPGRRQWSGNQSYGIAVDSSGNAYVTGLHRIDRLPHR